MLHCDIHEVLTIGGAGDDHLRFACADIPQCGEVALSYTHTATVNRLESGIYAVYARGYSDRQISLEFEGTCEQIQTAADCAKRGAVLVTGLYTGTDYVPNEMTGAFCYVDGSVSTELISKDADYMHMTLPVILRDTETRAASLSTKIGGTYGLRFTASGQEDSPQHTMLLSDCIYLGGGQYLYPEELPFDYGTGSAAVIGEVDSLSLTCVPTFGIRAEGESEFTERTLNPVTDIQEAELVDLPMGAFTCFFKLENPSGYAKPFQLYFRCRRYGG